ncbi:uncharacterized protein G2W53_033390 [Senna tora]|uniref:Uncharacterized protein n=1 Tax=Senna tora TaxID=362788 RepID=A0A834T9I1_9FABA|nr:uncharacterized protein G2W53_033390 [Senna tora]
MGGNLEGKLVTPLDGQIHREAIGFTHLGNNRIDLYFVNSFEVQSQNLVRNVVRHDFKLLRCDYESRLSFKNTRISKYNAKRSESHSSIKSTRIPKGNLKRSIRLTCATSGFNARIGPMITWKVCEVQVKRVVSQVSPIDRFKLY